MKERTDKEILAGRATVQFYHKRMLHILDNVLDGDLYKFGLFFAASLIYIDTQGDEVILDKDSDPIVWSAFQQYKYDLDKDSKKYIERSRKNAVSGSVGGKKKREA